MHIDRIGYTPLKGGRHLTHDQVDLALNGPIADRVFCLVDPISRKVLRTVENPQLLSTITSWSGTSLTVEFEDETITDAPAGTGEIIKINYWGRPAPVEIIRGPWADAFSRWLGRPVLLTKRVNPGDIVYGQAVSLITTSSLRLLAQCFADSPLTSSVTIADLAARFRMTFVVKTDDQEPHIEDSWIGREVQVGASRIRVVSRIPRCTVINFNPVTGVTDLPVLKTLATYRHHGQQIPFGVDAVVISSGPACSGDSVTDMSGS